MQLSGVVECDEVYVIAGHKGQPEVVKKKGRKGRVRWLKAKPGRGALASEKPPILGMIQRQGEVVIQMLPNVQQVTIAPIITRWKVSGLCFGLGSDLIVAFLRRVLPCLWVSLNSFIIPINEVRQYFRHFLPVSFLRSLKPIKSL